MIKLSLPQRGDTIVEVMIAVAIVGSVLTGAFAISNRSLQQIRMAQEQTEAQKIASSNVEKLNGFVADNPDYLNSSPPSPNPFCIGVNGGGFYEAVPAGCVTGGRYTTSIQRLSTNDNTFQVSIEWDGANGTPQTSSFTYHIKTPEGPITP